MAQFYNDYNNQAVLFYCPKFIQPNQIAPLRLNINTKHFSFNHVGPNQNFLISLKRWQFASRTNIHTNQKTNYLGVQLTPNTFIQVSSDNKYSITLFPYDDSRLVLKSDSLSIEKMINLNSFSSSLFLKFGKPIEIRSETYAGPTTVGYMADFDQNGNNTLYHSLVSPFYSQASLIKFHPYYLTPAQVSLAISFKYQNIRNVLTLATSNYLIAALGQKYKDNKLTIGLYNFISVSPDFHNDETSGVSIKYLLGCGIKYAFRRCGGKLVFFKDQWGIGGKFNVASHIIKPTLYFKYDNSSVAFHLDLFS